MDWTSITHFLHMAGQGFYVWSAYGMARFFVSAESFMHVSRRKAALERVKKEAARAEIEA